MTGISGLTGWFGTALSARDPVALAEFYSALLGWDIRSKSAEWVTIGIPGTTNYLAFAVDDQHVPPVWPSKRGKPTMQAHLDVGVRDVSRAVDDAVALGATVAAYQPQDDVRVVLDPAGHPFCLYLDD